MKKTILISLTFLSLLSCKDNREPWLLEYQSTECTLFKLEEKISIDSLKTSQKFSVELSAIKNEIAKIEKPIESEIIQLNHKIGEINIKYLNESRKISEKHEQVYGHISTPEFEKKLQQNDENNNREVLTIEDKITILQSKLNGNKTYKVLILKQNKIKTKIIEATNAVREKYATTFDSLKHKLDNQNSDFRMILQDLDNPEKLSFKIQREKIRANPCK
jgi:hypothetical protein